jgi:GNAT superfamily N-acetyltransferase
MTPNIVYEMSKLACLYRERGHVSVSITREFDHSHDTTALHDYFIELQNYECQLDPGKPEGSTIAAVYLNRMFARCRDWEGRIFVAEVAGQVVGFVCVWGKVRPEEPDENPAEYALVSDLVVRMPYRRRGIGKPLLSGAEHFARTRGATSLRIGVSAQNVAAKALYESIDFNDYKVELVKPLIKLQ